MVKHLPSNLIGFVFLIYLFGCGGGGSTNTPDPPPVMVDPEPALFHCSKDSTCPEIIVSGDPIAADSFRGYGDPSLEFDSSTNTLWMSYTYLNVLVSDVGPPEVSDFGTQTHLAKSVDNGNTFQYVRSVNTPEIEAHPDTGVLGWTSHEVSTLVKQSDGQWQILWMKYLNPLGTITGVDDRQEFLNWRTTVSTPENLGDNSQIWSSGLAASDSWNAPIDINSIAGLSDCAVLTESALFNFSNETYLVSSCLVVDSSGRRTDLERLALLRQTADSYEFIANIMDSTDADNLGVDVIQQADISIARDGSIIMIVTPIILGDDPSHQGCVVYEFENFATGELKRNNSGVALARNIITADGNGLGPGLCTYDPASDSGILLVITTFTNNFTDIEFSLRATGVHP